MVEGRSPSINGEPGGASTVERAFLVLQTVVAAGEPLGVREIGRRAGLPRSTVSRLVATLDGLAMVARTATGQIAPGSALGTLQPGGDGLPLLVDRLRPLLVELVERYGEHAALSVDDGDAVLYLALVEAEQPVSAPNLAAARHPFHVVAPGLLEMAHWPARRLAAYLDGPLAAPTVHSVDDPDAVAARVVAIRAAGHAWAEQELDVGVNGLAVPVLDDDGRLLAAISLYGPGYRFSPAERPGLGPELAALVADRSAALLGRWSESRSGH